MRAKDTVMANNIEGYRTIGTYIVGDRDARITVSEEVWNINGLLEAQAEISFKAGRREVMEWILKNSTIESMDMLPPILTYMFNGGD